MPSAAYKTKINVYYRNLFLVNLKTKKKHTNKQKYTSSWKFLNTPRQKSKAVSKKRFSFKKLIKKHFLETTFLKVANVTPFRKLPIGAKKTIISEIVRARKKLKIKNILQQKKEKEKEKKNRIRQKSISLSNFVLTKTKSTIRILKKNLILPNSGFPPIMKKKRYRRNMSRRSIPRRKYKAKYVYYTYAVSNIKSSLSLRRLYLKHFACIFIRPTRNNNFLTLCGIKKIYRYKNKLKNKKKFKANKKNKRIKKRYKYHVKYTCSAGIVKFKGKKKATYDARERTAIKLAKKAKIFDYRCADIRFKGRYRKIYTPALLGLIKFGLFIRLIRIEKKRSHGFKRLRKRRRI